MARAKKVDHEILMSLRGSASSGVVVSERTGRELTEDYGPDEVFDKQNPKSVYNMVPGSIRKNMDEIPEHLWMCTIKELESVNEDITPIDRRLRQSFWVEYDQAHKSNRGMMISNVIRGICSRTLFRSHIIARPHRLRYMLEPPEDYKITMQELLQDGMDQLREIMKLPLISYDFNGNQINDAKIAAVKLKAVEMLYNRLQGMPINRSMQITQNTNFNHNSNGPTQSVPDFSQVKDIEELEKMVTRLEGGSQVLDVTPSGGSKDGNGEGTQG